MLRCGALFYFGEQNEGVQNPVDSYTNCASANDLVMLLCCTKLAYQVHPGVSGVSQGVIYNLIPHCMGPCHGQILIETKTYSWFISLLIYIIQPNPGWPESYMKKIMGSCFECIVQFRIK